MPFGLIFGAVFFGLICLIVGVEFVGRSWGPAQAAGVLLLVLGVTLALGLLLRQSWARWTGVVSAVLVSTWMLVSIAVRGSVLDHVVFLAALATIVLLIIPATGNVRRGLPEGVRPSGRAGVILGLLAGGILVGFLLTGVWAWNVPFPGGGPRAAGSLLGAKIDWSEFGPGLEQAQRDGKLVFVDFYAEWCGPCHMMDRRTFRDPEVVSLLEQVVAVRVDSEDIKERHGFVGFELAQQYDVLTYPTVALLDAQGEVISRNRGYLGPAGFVRWLNEAMELAVRDGAVRTADSGVKRLDS